MKARPILFGALLAAASVLPNAAPAHADQIAMIGTLRDFKAGGDFENDYNGQYPLVTGMVKATLGSDGKPVLSPPSGSISAAVATTGTAKLSSVKLNYTDGTNYTYSGLSTKSGTYAVAAADQGKFIASVDIKVSGSSTTTTLADTTSHTKTSGTFSATFNQGSAIPLQWRVATATSFNQWFNNVPGTNQSVPYTLVLDNGSSAPGGVYSFARSTRTAQSFFPLDGQLFGNEGRSHNYHFTFELHTRFAYTDPAKRADRLVFNFSGDDDVWVFINHKLAIDLGGVHPEQFKNIDIDSMAAQLGLVPGNNYDFDFFYCERHTVESNLTIQTTLQFVPNAYD